MRVPPEIVRPFVVAVICLAGSLILAKLSAYLPYLNNNVTADSQGGTSRSVSTSVLKSQKFDDEKFYLDDQQSMFWIDNHRILYSSFRIEELKQIQSGGLTSEGQYRAPRVVRIFDLESGEIVDHALMGKGWFCFTNGNILYQKWADPRSSRVLLWGAIGQEKENQEVTRKLINGGFNAPIRCSGDEMFSYKYPNYMIALLEQHGAVEVRNSGKGQEGQLLLHRPNSASPVLIQGYMPVDAHSLENNAHTFHPWKGAYFITRTGRPYKAWWLFPDGTTGNIDIPSGPWDQIRNPRHVGFVATRAGLLVTTGCSVGVSCHKWYLLKGDMVLSNSKLRRHKKVDIGLSYRNAVSPDGCRLATTHGATGLGMTVPPKIKIVDLCEFKK